MSKEKTVEVWINEENELCFFDEGNTLRIKGWGRLAYLLIHEVTEEFEACGGVLDEPVEFVGEFGDEQEGE